MGRTWNGRDAGFNVVVVDTVCVGEGAALKLSALRSTDDGRAGELSDFSDADRVDTRPIHPRIVQATAKGDG